MPTIECYQIDVSVIPLGEATKPLQQNSASPGRTAGGQENQPEIPLRESFCEHYFLPGMTHPIYTSAIESPVTLETTKPLPFKIQVKFAGGVPGESLPEYMKGDIRVELRVDGVVVGQKIFQQHKMRGKGFTYEVLGLRCDRKKERPFVFQRLPAGTKAVSEEKDIEQSNIHRRFYRPSQDILRKAGVVDMKDLEQAREIAARKARDPCMAPLAPANIPENSSHIEVRVSVGAKFKTHEKYFMNGASNEHGFYYKPRLNAPLDPNLWNPQENMPGRKKVKRTGSSRKAINLRRKTGGLARLQPASSVDALQKLAESESEYEQEDRDDGTWEFEEQELARRIKDKASWAPVHFSHTVEQKVAQHKEVDFVAMIHVLRVWMFVVPSPKYILPKSGVSTPRKSYIEMPRTPPSLMLKLKVPPNVLDRFEVPSSRRTSTPGIQSTSSENIPAPDRSNTSAQKKQEPDTSRLLTLADLATSAPPAAAACSSWSPSAGSALATPVTTVSADVHNSGSSSSELSSISSDKNESDQAFVARILRKGTQSQAAQSTATTPDNSPSISKKGSPAPPDVDASATDNTSLKGIKRKRNIRSATSEENRLIVKLFAPGGKFKDLLEKLFVDEEKNKLDGEETPETPECKRKKLEIVASRTRMKTNRRTNDRTVSTKTEQHNDASPGDRTEDRAGADVTIGSSRLNRRRVSTTEGKGEKEASKDAA